MPKSKSLPSPFGKFTFLCLNGLLKSISNTYQIFEYPKMSICLEETSGEKILEVFDMNYESFSKGLGFFFSNSGKIFLINHCSPFTE